MYLLNDTHESLLIHMPFDFSKSRFSEEAYTISSDEDLLQCGQRPNDNRRIRDATEDDDSDDFVDPPPPRKSIPF